MSATEFQFSMGNINVELSGDRQFVERMYRLIMTDITEARQLRNIDSLEGISEVEPVEEGERIIWVHRCSEMMHKIYMATSIDLDAADLMRLFDSAGIQTVYCESDVVSLIVPHVHDGHTLWAELTEKGRQTIGVAAAIGSKPVQGKREGSAPFRPPPRLPAQLDSLSEQTDIDDPSER